MYDVVIIGSGLGGLSCGTILAKEGLRVCVVEQHRIAGGCLQSFMRNGKTFDTGIHYVGSMKEGQLMRHFLKYYGIEEKVRTIDVDEEAYETVVIKGKEYRLPTGRERFVEEMSRQFPAEREGLEKLMEKIMEVKNSISVEMLKEGKISDVDMQKYMAVSASEMIDSHIGDETLRKIMGGCSMLFGGERETSCFYHYAMVIGSNVEGSQRILGGSQTLANAMVEKIEEAGGKVMTERRVTKIATGGTGMVTGIETDKGETLTGKYYISAIHPSQTFEILEKTPVVKQPFVKRMKELKNSYGLFSVYVVLKEKSVPFRNTFYLIHDGDTWFDEEYQAGRYDDMSFMVSFKPSEDGKWAETASLIAPVSAKDYEKWAETEVGRRGEEYERWKSGLAETLIERYEKMYPGMKAGIDKIYTASPLTFRDYTLTPGGSAYGILKNYKNPLPTIIPTQTKLGNLLLTGQNIFVPGAIGVTMTAAITCANIVGEEKLAKRIGNLN